MCSIYYFAAPHFSIMIQRIQSIFLFLAALAMGLLFLPAMSFITIPFGDLSELQSAEQAMLGDAVFDVGDHIILLALTVVCIVLAVSSLFLFKNRPLQMKLGRILVIGISLVVLLSVLLFYLDFKLLAAGTEITVEYGYVLPVLALVFTILAIRAIRKDEDLVRSADRLR